MNPASPVAPSRATRHPGGVRTRSERGVAESTQWAILLPTLLLLVLGLVQVGVWLYSRTVAAQAAATVADLRVTGAAADAAAREAGLRIATDGGLQDVQIGVDAAAGHLVVTVSGRAPVFFDVGQGRIVERAVLPLERVTPP
ncbi:MAG: TadE/TadG family type IV pilus assembly protein [Propionicimonas sp.]|uniref:TadE/TadG family type IV pilus assembly protein n=1 Tax=Propionicimonas sp. TaxID=1955623 RepID=UPI003D0E867C